MMDFPPLEELTVEITQQCLQNCVHCSTLASKNSHQSLTRDEIISLTEDFIQLGGKEIEISGGEPFLHEDIFNVIAFLNQTNLKVVIYTCGKICENGDFKVAVDEIIKKLDEQRIDEIVFSLQGANAETHDNITRTPSSFSQTTYLIKKLVDDGHNVGIHYVPMSPNVDEFEDLVEFASRLGVKEIGVLRFVPQGRGEKYKEYLMLGKEESARLIELLAKFKKRKTPRVRIGSHLDFVFLLNGVPPKDCTAGKKKCLVESNGDVIPCPVFKGIEQYIAGNIRNTSLIEIWRDSDTFQRFRTFNPKSLKGSCSTCEFLYVCKGRCPAQRLYDTGDFYEGPDSYCPKDIFLNPKK